MSSLPTDVRTIARDAYTFGYAMIENYRTLYEQAVDVRDPRYTGGFGGLPALLEPFTPANTDIVTPNDDTPYSWGWFDLRAEPWVDDGARDRPVLHPSVPRSLHRLRRLHQRRHHGHRSRSLPARRAVVDGRHAGGLRRRHHLVHRFRRLYRSHRLTDGDLDDLRRIQHSYDVAPFHTCGHSAPAPAAPIEWPAWEEAAATDIRFYDYLDHLLRFAPVLDEDRAVRDRTGVSRPRRQRHLRSANSTTTTAPRSSRA